MAADREAAMTDAQYEEILAIRFVSKLLAELAATRERYEAELAIRDREAREREEKLREALRRIDDMADRTASTAAFRPDIAAVARAALSEGKG